jgi:hypothetical protein
MTSSGIRGIVLALGAAALVAGAGSVARADDDGWHHGHGREYRESEWREHEWREWCFHHPGAYAYPGYYCPVPMPPPPPAPVYYAPPPPPPVVIYAPPPPPPAGLEIVVPIHIR